jgi:hypothetical protein
MKSGIYNFSHTLVFLFLSTNTFQVHTRLNITVKSYTSVSMVIKDFSHHTLFPVTRGNIYVDDISTTPSRSLKYCIHGQVDLFTIKICNDVSCGLPFIQSA